MDNDNSVRFASSKDEFLLFMGNKDKKILIDEAVYGICHVVTSFLGVEPDHIKKRKKSDPPKIFESYVEDGPIDGSTRYYSSYEDAVEGHKNVVLSIKKRIH